MARVPVVEVQQARNVKLRKQGSFQRTHRLHDLFPTFPQKALKLFGVAVHRVELGEDKGADEVVLGLMTAVGLAVEGKAVVRIPVSLLKKAELIVSSPVDESSKRFQEFGSVQGGERSYKVSSRLQVFCALSVSHGLAAPRSEFQVRKRIAFQREKIRFQDCILISRVGQVDFQIGGDAAGTGAEDEHAISQQQRFVDIVGDEENRLGKTPSNAQQPLLQHATG